MNLFTSYRVIMPLYQEKGRPHLAFQIHCDSSLSTKDEPKWCAGKRCTFLGLI
jgi:hypothetical protein